MNDTLSSIGMDLILHGIRELQDLRGVLRRPQIQVTVGLFLFVLLCLTSYAIMTLTRKARMLRKFPAAWKLPIVGSIPLMLGSPESMSSRVAIGTWLWGRVFTFWLSHIPYLVITDADAVQKVLSSTKYIEKGKNYNQFEWLLGNGLITSNGHMWKEDRRLLSPSFKYQRFDGFLTYFNKHSKILVEILDKVFVEGNSKKDKSGGKEKDVNLHPYLSRATMDFISESALGLDSNFQSDIHAKFLEGVHMALAAVRTRVTRPWLTVPIIWDIFGFGKEEKAATAVFSEIMNENILKRREILSNNDGAIAGTKPFIDALLDCKSNKDITGHIHTIFGAGFETTASGMNYTLFLLALNPHLQAKVHEELDQVLGKTSEDLDVTFAHLADLKYLEMCIKETLRLFPPAPAILRNAVEDIPLETGQVIPKGVDMLFFLRDVHLDPRHFPNPGKFDPDRFLPEACASRHPYAYIPFSAGPRNCLGLKYAMVQMKCCLSHILRHFKVSTQQKRDDLKIVYGMVLETSPAIELTLTPREQ
ncbi:cytochrome P450 4C1 [Folsomia candida]|uniref:cytochrome P450 4C1 n=1 Tax=Folsomia candida TaxID=158441 RepID=UPI000B8FE079|nr:cytochrome P450 4C1 [Folsomia candida]XP_021962908.1 cytochrome P450 4C1 [Folsomia candida]XP_021962948.1 cytochrome P450 4C1 [Folsomia candida]XP_021962949.1 cytochrome P450 4C1 [Folsomia candida]